MNKALLIGIVIFLILVSFAVGYFISSNYVDSIKKINYNDSFIKCPEGNFLKNLTCGCPTGYTRVGTAFYTPEAYDYCKINKGWNDFELCKVQSDCSQNYSCGARTENETDLRCVPRNHYQMGCWCNPDGACLCT